MDICIGPIFSGATVTDFYKGKKLECWSMSESQTTVVIVNSVEEGDSATKL